MQNVTSRMKVYASLSTRLSTDHMQNLNKQIEENKSLRAENDALKAENNKVKQHISQLDEKAVERVTTQLGPCEGRTRQCQKL